MSGIKTEKLSSRLVVLLLALLPSMTAVVLASYAYIKALANGCAITPIGYAIWFSTFSLVLTIMALIFGGAKQQEAQQNR